MTDTETPTHPSVILRQMLEKSRHYHLDELEALKGRIFVHYSHGDISHEIAEDLLGDEFIAEMTEFEDELDQLLNETNSEPL